MDLSRRQFVASGIAASALWPACWVDAKEVSPDEKPRFRFAVASDLHYGQKNTPFAQMADDLVTWMDAEQQSGGLDAVFLNGDLSNDSTEALLTLRDKHLSKLTVPYYTIKGNHDFVTGVVDSPGESWDKIWGYPSNHVVEMDDFVFILADTSAPASASTYLAADIEWLGKQLKQHQNAPAIFAMIHIQQRRHGVDGWPRHGVHDKAEVPKAEAVMKLLESTENVRGVFHGHNHKETSVFESGGMRYFFDSHVGGSWGAKRGYRIVEIYADNRMLTYQMNAEDSQELNRHDLNA